MLSVVIPSYNEELMITRTAQTISGILQDASIDHELIFVDDGSKDNTWAKIVMAAETVPGVRGLHFSRNFGKEAAILAGLTEAKGECSCVIDCDLQMPPETMVEMYRLWEQGYEIIEGKKSSRGNESGSHAWAAHLFYSLISKATGFEMENTSDFKLLDRKAVQVIINMREKNGFFRAVSSWVGFRTASVEFDVLERTAGESKWSTKALIRYAIRNLTTYSTAPMQLIMILGVVMFLLSVVFGAIALVQKFSGVAADGFTTVILLILLIGSAIMISLGIIGYYLACIYEEIKGRPNYIISQRI